MIPRILYSEDNFELESTLAMTLPPWLPVAPNTVRIFDGAISGFGVEELELTISTLSLVEC